MREKGATERPQAFRYERAPDRYARMPCQYVRLPFHVERTSIRIERMSFRRGRIGDRSSLREIRSRLMQFPCHCARFHGTTAVPTSATRVPFSEKTRSIFVLTRTSNQSNNSDPRISNNHTTTPPFRANERGLQFRRTDRRQAVRHLNTLRTSGPVKSGSV